MAEGHFPLLNLLNNWPEKSKMGVQELKLLLDFDRGLMSEKSLRDFY
jgi:hypothetical protein